MLSIKSILLVIAFSVVLAVISFLMLLEKNIKQPLPFSSAQMLTVQKGSSVNYLASKLIQLKWIDNRLWLKVYARLNAEHVVIKAGTYEIPAHSSIQDILTILAEGKEYQFQITLVEGETFKVWLERLQNEAMLKHSLKGLTIEEIAKKLSISQVNPEGWFFPETYAFTKNTDDLSLLKRAHMVMKNKLAELWQSRAKNLPYDSPYQALIMASIIEKETSYIPEQPLIASVFINRLAKKMRLQTDPTVIYGLGEQYQGDITRAHLREKTPYNTYRIKGLPPTPIAMPGLSAIKAALNPATSDYYYFVSSGSGKHVFSKTLNEHNKAVKKYLAGINAK